WLAAAETAAQQTDGSEEAGTEESEGGGLGNRRDGAREIETFVDPVDLLDVEGDLVEAGKQTGKRHCGWGDAIGTRVRALRVGVGRSHGSGGGEDLRAVQYHGD